MSDSIMVSLFDRDDLIFVENEKGQFIHTDEIEKLDSEYLLKISQLEKENSEKDKLIAELKEELAKERKCVEKVKIKRSKPSIVDHLCRERIKERKEFK